MNNKLITAAIIITLSIVGFGIVSLTKDDTQTAKSDSTASDMSTMDMKDGAATSTDQALDADSDASAAQTASSDQVTYKGFAVVQKTLKVKKGTTVTWTNQDTAQHDVTPTAETAEFKASALFGKGETYQVTFNTPGTYDYICSPHPYMKGTIEVTE